MSIDTNPENDRWEDFDVPYSCHGQQLFLGCKYMLLDYLDDIGLNANVLKEVPDSDSHNGHSLSWTP